jgi:hypothetical protein
MSGYVSYEYDSLGNLIVSWDSAGLKEAFSYDFADNRTQNVVSSGSPPPPPAAQSMTQPANPDPLASGASSDDSLLDSPDS